MYFCQVTGKMSKPGEKINRITVQTRPRTYTKWVCDEETRKWEEVVVATGSEIVKEITASNEGEAIWQSWSAEERATFLKYLGR